MQSVNGVGFGLVQLLKFVYGAKVITITRSEQKKAIELDAILLLIQQTHSKVVNMGQNNSRWRTCHL